MDSQYKMAVDETMMNINNDPNIPSNLTEPENRPSIESSLPPPSPPPYVPTQVDRPESSNRAQLGTLNTTIANAYPYPPTDGNSTATTTNRYSDPLYPRTKYMNYRCFLKYQKYVYSSYFPENPTTTTPQLGNNRGDAMPIIEEEASEEKVEPQERLELEGSSTSKNPSTGEGSSDDKAHDGTALDLFSHFLVSLEQSKKAELHKMQEDIKLLDSDIEFLRKNRAIRNPLDTENTSLLWHKSLENFSQLESAYFSNVRPNETTEMDRTDTDVLRTLEDGNRAQPQPAKPVTPLGALYDGMYKLARFSKFKLCGVLKNSDDTVGPNKVCSLGYNRDEEYIASAGSEKIKVFKVGSFLYNEVNVRYPAVEMSNESNVSCISWNACNINHLASSDFDGVVKIWDVDTGDKLVWPREHRNRLWSVDFSRVDPFRFASGGDDCSVRLWSTSEKNSVGEICTQAAVCCVQYSAYSSHLLAFGSSDHKIYLYDLRQTRTPWCTIAGHERTVSHVRFLDSETLVSASKDNTLKLWDLKKTYSVGPSTNACRSTFTGHKNRKKFVGMAVSDGYIATGSETNEVYAYDVSFPTPIATQKLVSPLSGDNATDCTKPFVSSVCWKTKHHMLVAGNSIGEMNIFRMDM